MGTLKESSISEDLSPCETEAEQKERHIKGRPSFSVFYDPPIWQVRSDGQQPGLKYEECNEKAKMTPKEARNLGLNSGASELERWDIWARYSATGVSKRKKHFEKRICDYGRLLQSEGPFYQE